MASEINKSSVLLSGPKGGTLDVISREGELLYQIWVPPGRQRASSYLDVIERGATLEISGDGLVARQPVYGMGRQGPDLVQDEKGVVTDLKYASGANPDFQPMSTAEKLAEKTRRDMALLSARLDRAEKRERANAQIERIPRAPEGQGDVIEPPAPPAPAPAPAPVEPAPADAK